MSLIRRGPAERNNRDAAADEHDLASHDAAVLYGAQDVQQGQPGRHNDIGASLEDEVHAEDKEAHRGEGGHEAEINESTSGRVGSAGAQGRGEARRTVDAGTHELVLHSATAEQLLGGLGHARVLQLVLNRIAHAFEAGGAPCGGAVAVAAITSRIIIVGATAATAGTSTAATTTSTTACSLVSASTSPSSASSSAGGSSLRRRRGGGWWSGIGDG